MKNHTEGDSRSPPRRGGTVTRAPAGAQNDTAQPSLTSGFGTVIERERDLQRATEATLGQTRGRRSAELDRILRHQHSRLGANIALLEQRYEALPIPARFVNWHDRGHPSPRTEHMGAEEAELLPRLVEQHTRLLIDISALIDCAPDGQRGELILAEVSRSHEEMAWMLTALMKEDESTKRMADHRNADGSGGTGLAQENWDNEGGPIRSDLPAGQERFSQPPPK